MTPDEPTLTVTRPPHIDPRRCIRNPQATWTSCLCDSCRPERNRMAKLARNGIHPKDRRAEAWDRFTKWCEAGFTAADIGRFTGISDAAIRVMIKAAAAGTRTDMLHATALRILDASPDTLTRGLTSSAGTVRRLQALTVMGWSMDHLSAESGLAPSTLAALRDPKHRHTRREFAAIVADLYRRLSGIQGPAVYAGTRAKNRGWAPPAAWDDDMIDDPDAEPQGLTERGKRSYEDLIEDVEHLLAFDPILTSQAIADRLGYSDKSGITNGLKRSGRQDLLERLARNAEYAGYAVTRRSA